jgi:ABC-type nitrate/sulfonate/bicarbonate transport system substrate-binding protein
MVTIKFAAVSRNYFNMPIWVAQHCGFFRDEGIKLDIELYEPIDEVTERLQDGRAQLAFGVTEHVILDREAGGNLLIIGGNVNKLAFTLIANNKIKKPQDLRNKVIGVSSIQAGSSSLIMKSLESYGLKYPQDYSIKEVGPILARWDKLQSGEIDAGLQGAPLNYIAIDQGFTALIEPRENFPDFQFTSLNVDEIWANKNAKTLNCFMRAFIRAHHMFFEDKSLMIDIAIKETGISEKYAEAAWEEYTREGIFSLNGDVNTAGVQTLIDISALIRAIKQRKGTSAKSYINQQFLEKALIDITSSKN